MQIYFNKRKKIKKLEKQTWLSYFQEFTQENKLTELLSFESIYKLFQSLNSSTRTRFSCGRGVQTQRIMKVSVNTDMTLYQNHVLILSVNYSHTAVFTATDGSN